MTYKGIESTDYITQNVFIKEHYISSKAHINNQIRNLESSGTSSDTSPNKTSSLKLLAKNMKTQDLNSLHLIAIKVNGRIFRICLSR
jgi:hypothetical protein